MSKSPENGQSMPRQISFCIRYHPLFLIAYAYAPPAIHQIPSTVGRLSNISKIDRNAIVGVSIKSGFCSCNVQVPSVGVFCASALANCRLGNDQPPLTMSMFAGRVPFSRVFFGHFPGIYFLSPTTMETTGKRTDSQQDMRSALFHFVYADAVC